MPQPVDHAAIKSGQILSIAMLVVAYVLDRWEPVAMLSAIFLITALAWDWGPFCVLYRFGLKPLCVVRPDVRDDNLPPHRFGQAVGAATAALAAIAIWLGYGVAGWTLVWVLIILTAISFAGWCIGCFLYYQLNRLGLGGFYSSAPADDGVPLGSRPRRNRGSTLS